MASVLRENVDSIRKKRGLSKEQLADRVQKARADIEKALDRDAPPKTLVAALADQLVVPEFAFYMKDPGVSDNLIDFRDSEPGRNAYKRNTLKAIEAGRSIQTFANKMALNDITKTILEMSIGNTIEERAKSLRSNLGITAKIQLEAKDARVFYNLVRKNIENSNVFVTQYSFDDGAGFCLTADRGFDYICINTKKQTYQRRLFTLGHEIYHCILNRTGLSDPEIAKNKLERQCNKFSAEFLAPPQFVNALYKRHIKSRNFQINELSQFAKASKLSLYASVLRLVELELYDKEALLAWNAFRQEHSNPDSETKQGGQRVEEWKYKLAKHGFKFADVYGKALAREQIDELDIFRLSRIKPQYQGDYFSFASSAEPEDVEDE